MSTNNKVYQVLVTKGNQDLAAKNSKLSDLKDGQLGIFDKDTNLAIDETSAVNNFYFAVGVGNGENINTSAGQYIQGKNIRDITLRKYRTHYPFIFEINNYGAVECEKDYALKLEFRNEQVYMRQGYNQFAKTYSVRTSCCDECSTACPSGSAAELTKLLVQALNADESKLFKAEPLQYDAQGEDSVIPDIDAFIADPANKTVKVGIKVTTLTMGVKNFYAINSMYYNSRETVIIPSLVDGFGCNASVKVIQDAEPEEGSGYDIKQKEYFAGGWNGRPGPYRTSSVTGLPMSQFLYFANEAEKYNQFNFVYDHFSTAGWGEYLNNLMTVIAVPKDDITTFLKLGLFANKLGLPKDE